MRRLTRRLPMLALSAVALATPLAGQDSGAGTGAFKWYFGAYAGAMSFETTAQEDKAAPVGGLQFFVTAKRTALRLSIEEAFSSDNVAVYPDATAPGGVQTVTFNNIRKYSLLLMAVPLQGHVQPYIGVGVGWMHIINPQVAGSPSDPEAARKEAVDRGSVGFGSGVAGIQFRTGKFVVFGTYQITGSPSSEKYLVGPTHTLVGGIRFSLGPSRENF